MCDQRGCTLFWSFLYLLTGLSLGGLGAWMCLDEMVFTARVLEKPDLEADSGAWFGMVLALMALGAYCVVAGVVGLAGAGCRHRGTIIAFMVLACIGTAITITFAGIVTADFCMAYMDGVYKNGEENMIADVMSENLLTYYTHENNTDDFTEAWNRVQINYDCCGVESYTDYQGGEMANNSYSVPSSCCVTCGGDIANLDACRTEAEVTSPHNFTYLNADGCQGHIFSLYNRDLVITMSIGIGALLLQVTSILVVGCVGTNVKHGTWSPGNQ